MDTNTSQFVLGPSLIETRVPTPRRSIDTPLPGSLESKCMDMCILHAAHVYIHIYIYIYAYTYFFGSALHAPTFNEWPVVDQCRHRSIAWCVRSLGLSLAWTWCRGGMGVEGVEIMLGTSSPGTRFVWSLLICHSTLEAPLLGGSWAFINGL